MIEDSGELFSFEIENPTTTFGRDSYWIDVKNQQPELTVNGEELFLYLLLSGHAKSEHFEELRKLILSKFVLTFGRQYSKNLGYEYAIGFWDGNFFRDFDGYRLYPDPTHWVYFPTPPNVLNETLFDSSLYEH